MKLEMWKPLIDFEKEWEAIVNLPRLGTERFEFPFRPSMDVTRTEDHLIITAELPGIDPEKHVEITVDENYLTLKGEKSEETEVSEDHRFMSERKYGKFIRRIPVPEGVSADNIKASYAKGILTVTVQFPEEVEAAEPERIKVEVEPG